MGAVGGMLGLGGGGGGSGFATPQSTNIQSPTTDKQAQDAYTANQAALTQQQDFLKAVQAQNGLQNQSSVYNQLQGVANGTGPNPALAQLRQATGANVANQAALMAGQRGAGQNVGLIARQAAQQGANTQQQAAGQGATLQANQSLNALQGMGNLATNQANMQANQTQGYTQAQQAEQSQLLNAIAAQNASRVGMQSNINSANAALAGGRMGQQPGAIGGIMNAMGPLASMFGGGGGGGGLASTPMGDLGGGGGAAGNAVGIGDAIDAGGAVAAKGGQVEDLPKYATGQMVISPSDTPLDTPKYQSFGQFVNQQQTAPNPDTEVKMPAASSSGGGGSGNFLGGLGMAGAGAGAAKASGDGGKSDAAAFDTEGAAKGATTGAGIGLGWGGIGAIPGAIIGGLIGGFGSSAGKLLKADGGEVPALVSPGEQYLPPEDVKQVAKGKNPLSVGERIPGEPKVKGNNYSNDTVPKKLEEGGIIIPNSVMQSKDPAKNAAKFVAAILAKKGHKLPKKSK